MSAVWRDTAACSDHDLADRVHRRNALGRPPELVAVAVSFARTSTFGKCLISAPRDAHGSWPQQGGAALERGATRHVIGWATSHQLGRHGVLAPSAARLGETLALFVDLLAVEELPVPSAQPRCGRSCRLIPASDCRRRAVFRMTMAITHGRDANCRRVGAGVGLLSTTSAAPESS